MILIISCILGVVLAVALGWNQTPGAMLGGAVMSFLIGLFIYGVLTDMYVVFW